METNDFLQFKPFCNYWSSTTYAYDSDCAWIGAIFNGDVRPYLKIRWNSVRALRADK
jgi:hypothetical protein